MHQPIDDTPTTLPPDTFDLAEFKADWNWQAAFSEAIEGKYISRWGDESGPISEVAEVIAACEGENDGPDWIAIVRFDAPRWCYAVVHAGCDYTGWDCRAGGNYETYQSLDAACSKLALGDEERRRLADQLVRLQAAGRVKLDW